MMFEGFLKVFLVIIFFVFFILLSAASGGDLDMQQLKKKFALDDFSPFFNEFWMRSFDFTGKTRRKDFWLAVLQLSVVYLLIGIPFALWAFFSISNSQDPISAARSVNQTTSFYSWGLLAISFIPSLSIQIRRLNDIGKEPVWVLLSFIPFISFLLIFWYSKPSFKKGSNLVKEKSIISGESTLNDLDYVEDRLLKLKSMLETGVISDEEYKELRKKTLGL